MARPAIPASERRHVDTLVVRPLPILTTLLAAVISLQPIRIPGYDELTPAFTLMAVYHWTIYRPDLVPPLSLLMIGVAQDLVTGAPVGITALVLLFARASVLHQRRYFVNRPFPFMWAGFAMLTGGAMLFVWLLHCVLDGAMLDSRVTAFRAVLTIFLFPLASFLLGRTQRALMGAG